MYTLNKCKEETMKLCRSKGWDDVSVPMLWMLLTEEIGELASAIRRSTHNFSDGKRTNIEGEIMDVLSYLFQIAHIFNIDLDKEWEKYQNKRA